MIAPQELRLGNLVEYDGKIFKVKEIRNYIIVCDRGKGNVDFTSKEIEPIELTEEWLLKFGFDKRTNYQFIGNKITIESWNHKASFDVRLRLSEESSVIICEIKYVHQFQNLTFALTGEELKI